MQNTYSWRVAEAGLLVAGGQFEPLPYYCHELNVNMLPSFISCPAPLRSSRVSKVAIRQLAKMTLHKADTAVSRRSVVRIAILSGLAALVPLSDSVDTVHAREPPNTSSKQAVVPIAMCQYVLNPVERYIKEGSWDRARTNVNYCTRVLAVRKNMQAAAKFLSGDGYYDGMEIAGDVENLFTQLDASVYTPIFIPSDDGVSLEQRKYQTEAFDYLKDIVDCLDRFLRLFSDEDREYGMQAARSAKYQIIVDKQ